MYYAWCLTLQTRDKARGRERDTDTEWEKEQWSCSVLLCVRTHVVVGSQLTVCGTYLPKYAFTSSSLASRPFRLTG